MKPTVLVVDDLLELCSAYRRMLSQDFEVLIALNIESAKQLASEVDAILTDWNIGRETPESLLNDFPIPTVIITSDPSQAPRGIRTLAKPSTPEEICSSLKEEIDKVSSYVEGNVCPNCDDPNGLQQTGPSSFQCQECQYHEIR